MKIPKVTFAIPTIGRTELWDTIQSIVDQTDGSWNVVVSDNSNNKEVQKRVLNLNDDRITYIAHKYSLGPVGNYNFCLELCTGEYLVIMHDDDLLAPKYVEIMTLKMKESGASWGFCNGDKFGVNGFISQYNFPSVPVMYSGRELIVDLLSRKRAIIMPSVIYHNTICSKIRFDANYLAMCDIKMWIELANTSDFTIEKSVLFHTRIGDSNGTIQRSLDGDFLLESIKLRDYLREKFVEEFKEFNLRKITNRWLYEHFLITAVKIIQYQSDGSDELKQKIKNNSHVTFLVINLLINSRFLKYILHKLYVFKNVFSNPIRVPK